MKKLLLMGAGIMLFSFLSAQEEIHNPDGSYFKQCSSFSESEPLWKLAKEHPAPKPDGKVRIAPDDADHFNASVKKYDPNATAVFNPAVQTTMGTMTAPAPIQNFDGQVSSQGYEPLDDNGMVGPNHFVQTVNSDYQVFSKTGTGLTVSAALSALFPGTGDQGDPVVIYDKIADRWVIEEFNGSGYNQMMFAVSKTADPTGAYYIFKFTPDASDFADYPKYVVWSDGYYQTCNCQNDKIVVYDRTKMLAGNASAGFIVIPWTNPNTGGGFFCPMLLDADGALPPVGSNEFLWYYTTSVWGGGWADQIVIQKITVNWTAKTGSYANYQTLNINSINDNFNGRTSIDQPGYPGSLDALDGFFSYRIPYQRWGKYNSAVMCCAENMASGSIQSGMRWFEVRQDTTTKQWSVYQQSTFSPSDGISRWNGSIAMNNNGDIAMGYTGSSSSVYPSVRYTGRRSCDSLNKMTVAEQVAYQGTTSDGSGANRWGDYSNTSIDPSDGITFWHTNMYVNTGGAMATRIVSFQVPTCTPTGIPNLSNSMTIKAYQSGSMLNVNAINMPENDVLDVTLYDVDGRQLTNKEMTAFSGKIETSFNVSTYAKGMYFVRVGNSDYQRVIKVEIQ